MADQVDIKVSEGLVRSIIEAKVQAAISEALMDHAGVVEQVVSAALQQKVDDNGQVSKYSSENRFTYLEWLCRSVIRTAATEATVRWAATRQKELEEEFFKQLQTKKTATMLAKSCLAGVIDAAGSQYRLNVSVTGG